MTTDVEAAGPKLTPFKIRVLEALEKATDEGQWHTGRSMAATLWPDSPAWNKRTRGSGASRSGGNAMAGTMPMKGAKAMWDVQTFGYSTMDESYRWRITRKGRERLAVHRAAQAEKSN